MNDTQSPATSTNRKSINLLDESTDDFQQNFKLIKENKLKLTNISRYLVPKTNLQTSATSSASTSINEKSTTSNDKKSTENSKQKTSTKTKSKKLGLNKLNDSNNYKKQSDNKNEKISKYFQQPETNSEDLSKKGEENKNSKFSCPLCSVDLSNEIEQNRQSHVNQCLDKFSKRKNDQIIENSGSENHKTENKRTENIIKIENKPADSNENDENKQNLNKIDKKFAEQMLNEGIPNCPICGKILYTLNSHQAHMKKCATEFHIKPESLVDLVKRQKEKILKDLNNGFIPTDIYIPKKAPANKEPKKRKQPSRILKLEQPTNQQDEELLTAIALSKSLCVEEEHVYQLQIDQCLGGNIKKTRNKQLGNSNQAVAESQFLLADDEDRRKVIEKRLSEILMNQMVLCEPKCTNNLIKSKFSNENNYLWDKCKYFSQSNESFYVNMFIKNANFNVGGLLFLQTQTQNKFADITLINTQTAFLLADLNNTTQLNLTTSTTQQIQDTSTVLTPFGEFLQSQLVEEQKLEENLEAGEEKPQISENILTNTTQITTQTAFILADLNSTTQATQETLQTENLKAPIEESFKRETIEEEQKIEDKTEPINDTVCYPDNCAAITTHIDTVSVEIDIETNSEEINVDPVNTIVEADETLNENPVDEIKNGDIETNDIDIDEQENNQSSCLEKTLLPEEHHISETIIENEELDKTQIDTEMADIEEVISVHSDDSNSSDIIIEQTINNINENNQMNISQHISETAFIIDDSSSNIESSIILETTKSSTTSSELPSLDYQPRNLDFEDELSNSFKKYGKRKSISMDNILMDRNENKIIKLDDTIDNEIHPIEKMNKSDMCLITDHLNEELNKTSNENNEINDGESNYDEIWNNFNENQYDNVYNYDNYDNQFIVDDTFLDENKEQATSLDRSIVRSSKTPVKPAQAPQFSNNSNQSLIIDDSICETESEIKTASPVIEAKSIIKTKKPDEVKVFKTPKIMNIVKEAVDSPLTPMPNYTTMNTPSLKDELKRFGIKALPRKQAVRKLVEIYEYTHKNKLMRKSKSCTDLMSSVTNKNLNEIKNKITSIESTEPTEAGSTTKSILKPKKPRLKKTVSNIDNISAHTSEKPKESNKNDLAQFEIDDQQIPLSQQSITLNEDEIKKRIYEYISINSDLYNKVLNYEPLDFESFFQEIKNLGQFKINTKLLMKILDEFCITFTLKNIRSRISKFRSKKKH